MGSIALGNEQPQSSEVEQSIFLPTFEVGTRENLGAFAMSGRDHGCERDRMDAIVFNVNVGMDFSSCDCWARKDTFPRSRTPIRRNTARRTARRCPVLGGAQFSTGATRAAGRAPAQILLQFKNSIEDPMNTLSDWSNTTAIHHCNWTGVSCTNEAPLFVSSLNLQSLNLSGEISPSLCKLVNLTHLNLADNLFNQPIPLHLSECNSLVTLNLSNNLIWGTIPEQISLFKPLEVVFQGFGNFTELMVLDLSHNPFLVSEIPVDIGGLSKLEQLLLQRSAKGLVSLSLHTNFFNGSIYNEVINKCTNLEMFEVQNNGFRGNFPSWLWSLPKIKLIRAENNRFSGEIPDSISEAAQLEHVQIDNNSFTSKFPPGVGKVRSLYRFSASLNGLYGELPPNFCDSPMMSIFNLSNNFLSGRIPEVRKCRKLVSLSLANNSLFGEIPESLADLPVLTYLDLSQNNLTGSIPQELEKLKLALFNVSFNQLSGRVPLSLISGLPASFLQGNPGLCGPGLPHSCLNDKPMSKPSARGCGGNFGRVYVVNLPSGELVAVKKILNFGSQSSKSLKNEVKTLAKIRHKNIVKILGFCHSDDAIFLIYEYLPKGSLGDLIGKTDFNIPWSVRLKIAIGIAQGLAYLHRDYVPHLLNRNLKSNNVLLDDDFEPKLTDFALNRIVGENTFQSIVASECASSCYLAPEYGHTKKATEQNDTYSFGVVLLELLTGRQAEQNESGEEPSLDVVKWVRRKINITNGAIKVLDPKISSSSREQMVRALEIGLHCTSVIPEKRPSMCEVVKALQSLETSFQGLELSTSTG
ncbi:hypothetical protein DH2020_016711 [Rehmannia glutinosa]|uniref:Protein kinase domain-containing protein n=1 Tax=Rehmannia glutinosa TaxID=99300 RepID=A0ABR0WQH5_REHGL